GNFIRSFKGWPLISVNASCARINDFDGDGKEDIFIGARSVAGAYGVIPSSVLLHNNGQGNFTDVTDSVAPDLLKLGMVTDAQWADIDGDGKKELIVVGDWMAVTILKYKDGKLKKIAELPNSSGWWNCLTVADVNGDGLPDLVAGNLGLNSKIKADADHPARLYVGDFNKNGRSECIPVYYKSDGKAYPFNLRGDMVTQIPGLKKKFLRYESYAGKSIEEVFSKDQLEEAKLLTVNQTQTCIFINEGKGKFRPQPLPLQAQLSPVFGIYVADLNGDGINDIFLGGNFFALKPEVGRYDASYGSTFLGNKEHRFTYISPAESGLFIKGEIRDIQGVETGKGRHIVVARNNDSLAIFQKRN
ncbi:MAG TPA: VCBS repeat-containing protein, partial [Puia sp.]|nr:VCBS repeat-containing protein [Puia sp.]